MVILTALCSITGWIYALFLLGQTKWNSYYCRSVEYGQFQIVSIQQTVWIWEQVLWVTLVFLPVSSSLSSAAGITGMCHEDQPLKYFIFCDSVSHGPGSPWTADTLTSTSPVLGLHRPHSPHKSSERLHCDLSLNTSYLFPVFLNWQGQSWSSQHTVLLWSLYRTFSETETGLSLLAPEPFHLKFCQGSSAPSCATDLNKKKKT